MGNLGLSFVVHVLLQINYMGGCILQQKRVDKTLVNLPEESKRKPLETQRKTSDKPKEKQRQRTTSNKETKQNPFKQIIQQQIYHQYEIAELLFTATTLQGPRLIINRVNGSMKACRIIKNALNVSEERILKFKDLIKGLTFKIGDYYIFNSELLTGPSLLEFLITKPKEDCSQILHKVYSIITAIHDKGFYHGNLTFQSFRFETDECKELKLCELNFMEKGEDLFGMLHKNSKEADWEFFGIFLHTVTEGSYPFYNRQTLSYKGISNKAVETGFLKGKQTILQETQKYIVSQNLGKVFYSYLFRINVYKLLKIRTKRKRFQSQGLYDIESKSVYQSQSSKPLQQRKNNVQYMRVIDRLKKDILPHISQSNQEEYEKLTIGGHKLNELRTIFKMEGVDNKIDQIRYKIKSISL